jgi:hypothetical protein
MKYDIAKNDDGPLRRTVRAAAAAAEEGKGEDPALPAPIAREPAPTAQRHPGLDERLRNVEAHFAVRYGTRAELRLAEVPPDVSSQCRRPRGPSSTGSGTSKTTSRISSANTRRGRRSTSTSRTAAYVSSPQVIGAC